VHALQTADTYSVPRKKASYYKFWWDVEASELKYKSVDAHRLWVAAGRPRNGDCFNRMHNAKLQYKLCLRKLRKADTEGISNELNDCLLQKDTDSFWKCWKSKFNSPIPVVHAVNGCTNDIDIAETFVDFFSGVCRPNSILQNDQLRDQFLAQFDKYVGAETDLSVSINVVASSICRLKKGEAPGIDGIMAEHLINCHPIIYCVLQKLFKAIVSHGYVPVAFGAGIVIPLLNSGLDKSNMDNYRAITISPVISKVFESYLLGTVQDYLTIHPSFSLALNLIVVVAMPCRCCVTLLSIIRGMVQLLILLVSTCLKHLIR